MNSCTATGPLVIQRLIANWRLLLVLAFGILVAATLLAVSPVYTRVMNDLGLQSSLGAEIGSASRNGLTLTGLPLGDPANAEKERTVVKILADELGWLTGSEVRYGALPNRDLVRGDLPPNPQVWIRTHGISGLEEHVRLVDGRFSHPPSPPSATPIPSSEEPPIVTVILPEQSFFQALPQLLAGMPSEFRFTAFADITRLNSANISRALETLEGLEDKLEKAGAIADLAMARPLARFENRAAFNQV